MKGLNRRKNNKQAVLNGFIGINLFHSSAFPVLYTYFVNTK